jgi:hypothetical protein
MNPDGVISGAQRLGGAFAATIAAVGDDRWSSPTPCAEWTARDLVGAPCPRGCLGLVGQEGRRRPDGRRRPAGAWTARTATSTILRNVEFDGFFGRQASRPQSTGSCAPRRARWDLAATGLTSRWIPTTSSACRRAFGEAAPAGVRPRDRSTRGRTTVGSACLRSSAAPTKRSGSRPSAARDCAPHLLTTHGRPLRSGPRATSCPPASGRSAGPPRLCGQVVAASRNASRPAAARTRQRRRAA